MGPDLIVVLREGPVTMGVSDKGRLLLLILVQGMKNSGIK
jgi:hypothetical protein